MSVQTASEQPIADLETLVGLLGEPGTAAANKARPALHELDRAWLAATPH